MLKFVVSSTKTVCELDSDKRYVLYTICVRQNTLREDLDPSYIQRRYTQFLELYNSLKKDFSSLMSTFNFPKKVMVGNFSSALIACRSAYFVSLLEHIIKETRLREAQCTMAFFQDVELAEAKNLMNANKYDQALSTLENLFKLLNRVYTDRSHIVIMSLCRLVACGIGGSSATSSENAVLAGPTERWAKLALHRFDGVSDTDLLSLYVPLLKSCILIWKTLGKDSKSLEDTLDNMKRVGMRVDNSSSLSEAIEKLEESSSI
ncbi:sorting nexin 21 isoform X2 [Arctopsyche grandis]